MNIMTKLKTGAASVLGRLPKLSSSAEFAAALPDLQTEIEAAEARLAALEAQREDAIFTSPEALAALNGEIAAAEAEIKTLRLAHDGAERRRLAAVERERISELERTMAEAAANNAALTAAYIEFDAQATKLAETATRIRKLKSRIIAANQLAAASDRRDLRVDTVIARFAVHLADKAGGPAFSTGYYDPTDDHLHISCYFPSRSGFSDFLKAER